ncbi:ComEA family DNA-binding protein [Mycobacterium sp.]|uniref:ComEA family DNA-binding protein n=1 Tax=Mycobacterium sp. TaxID=1785 RepID=UPI0012762FD5|nr:ComEA family DNA-binding protein [Mycobacterium sp.]KAA8967323.1 MAG: ComEA family DNA-binding protein [Mycobacterium sp.]
MRTELPAERLRRRLGARPDTDPADDLADGASHGASDGSEHDPDGANDQNSLLPRWLPDGSAQRAAGWWTTVRADPGRAGATALAAIAAVAVLITVFTVIRDHPAPVASAKLPPVEMASSHKPTADPSAGPAQPVVVSVVGLVHTPGLVTLAPGARIDDALKAAGGALAGADTIGLNMARQVSDGEQIVVGIAPTKGQPSVLGSSVNPGAAAAAAPGKTTPPSPAKHGEAIDLNTATVQQLDALPGVGPVTAAAIVAWRDANGKFSSVDQLAEVDGIGPARLEKLRALVRV